VEACRHGDRRAGGEAMLRLTNQQRDFWEDLLPAAARRLSPELQAIDAFLDDERFLAHSLAYRAEDASPRIEYRPVTITRWPPGKRVYGR